MLRSNINCYCNIAIVSCIVLGWRKASNATATATASAPKWLPRLANLLRRLAYAFLNSHDIIFSKDFVSRPPPFPETTRPKI